MKRPTRMMNRRQYTTERAAIARPFASRRGALFADQRGAVAFETLIVYLFMVTALLLPLADVTTAGVQFIRAWGALRDFGEYLQYPFRITGFDPTVSSTWPSGRSIGGYQISNPQVLCGDTSAGVACTASNVATLPTRYFTYSTTVTLSPILLTSVLCVSGNTNPCSYTLASSVRFQ